MTLNGLLVGLVVAGTIMQFMGIAPAAIALAETREQFAPSRPGARGGVCLVTPLSARRGLQGHFAWLADLPPGEHVSDHPVRDEPRPAR